MNIFTNRISFCNGTTNNGNYIQSCVNNSSKPICIFTEKQNLPVPESKDTALSDNIVKGSNNPELLEKAPSSEITVAGEKKHAKFVLEIKDNLLYKYDDEGKPSMVYLVTTGKQSTPTKPAIKCVMWTEKYPYKEAPGSKRNKNPQAYGPRVIVLYTLDTETGKSHIEDGQFLHGNNNSSSLGKHVSLGCVRTDNDVIKKLAAEVKKGDIVVFK